MQSIFIFCAMDAKWIQLEEIDINAKNVQILIFVKIVIKKKKKNMDMNLLKLKNQKILEEWDIKILNIAKGELFIEVLDAKDADWIHLLDIDICVLYAMTIIYVKIVKKPFLLGIIILLLKLLILLY